MSTSFPEKCTAPSSLTTPPKSSSTSRDVTFCDSSGFAALDRAYAEGARRDKVFRVINVQPQVRRLLEILDMLDILLSRTTRDR